MPPPSTAQPRPLPSCTQPPQQHSLSWLWTTTMEPAYKKRSRVTRIKRATGTSETKRKQKKQRRRCTTDQREHVARVFQTEGIPEHVLLLLDIESVEAYVAFLGELGSSVAHRVLQDETLWSGMLYTHFKIPRTVDKTTPNKILARTRCKTHRSKSHAMDALLRNSGGGSCASLGQFLSWSQEREWFNQHVDVIMSDSFFTPHVPFVVFKDRAYEIRNYGSHGLAIVDPVMSSSTASNTQVRCMIHVIDARMAIASPWESLSRSFEDALDVIQRERCLNVAVVTPSPSLLSGSGATENAIAVTGLHSIQQFAIQQDWNARIGIVCYDEQRFQAFKAQKQQLLDAFGSVSGLSKLT